MGHNIFGVWGQGALGNPHNLERTDRIRPCLEMVRLFYLNIYPQPKT